MKKFMAMLLALTMLLALVACGGNNSTNTPSTSTPSTSTPSTSTPSTSTPSTPAPAEPAAPSIIPADPPAKTVEIELWYCNTGNTAAYIEEMCAKFNESQSNYKVTPTYSGSYAETLTKLSATDPANYPDVFAQDTEGAYTVYARDEMFIPLQDFIDADGFTMPTFMGNLQSAYSSKEGQWLAMPMGNTAAGMFYNAEILKANGIDPDTGLADYGAILETCRKLKAAGIEMPFGPFTSSSYITMALTAQGIQYVDNNNGKDGVPTKSLFMEGDCHTATVEFFDFLQTMTREGLMVPYGTASKDTRALFVEGKCAVMTSFISSFNTVNNAVNGAFEFGFKVLGPVSKGAKAVGACAGGGCMFVAETGDAYGQAGGWELLKWFMKDEHTAGFAMASGYMPTTKEGQQTAEYQEFIKTTFPTVQKAIDFQAQTPESCYNAWLPMFTDFHALCGEWYSFACNNLDVSPEEVTQRYAEAVDECIELYRLQYGL